MYKRKDSMRDLGSLCAVLIWAALQKLTNSPIGRTITLAKVAIRQTMHDAFSDQVGSNSLSPWVPGGRRRQKWTAWTVVDSRMMATHTAARQLTHCPSRDILRTS
jgi:hypothetical protein